MGSFHLPKQNSIHEFEYKSKTNMNAVFFGYCADEGQRQFINQFMTTTVRL
jgi:hypothetical protein